MLEQVEPYHLRQYIRDVPQSCICTWEWSPARAAWMRLSRHRDCIWHALWSGGARA